MIHQNPPPRCEVCSKQILNIFIDEIILIDSQPVWANVCLSCHHRFGYGLYRGKGTEYWLDPISGDFKKLETGKKNVPIQ